jgi:hypothetical protein
MYLVTTQMQIDMGRRVFEIVVAVLIVEVEGRVGEVVVGGRMD